MAAAQRASDGDGGKWLRQSGGNQTAVAQPLSQSKNGCGIAALALKQPPRRGRSCFASGRSVAGGNASGGGAAALTLRAVEVVASGCEQRRRGRSCFASDGGGEQLRRSGRESERPRGKRERPRRSHLLSLTPRLGHSPATVYKAIVYGPESVIDLRSSIGRKLTRSNDHLLMGCTL